MEKLLQDVRYGIRMLLKKPGFTLIAVITLALGIGANTAIFSVVNGIVLRSLPYAEPERLSFISIDRRDLGPRFTMSRADYLLLKEHMQSFEKLAEFRGERLNMTGGREPERIVGTWATAEFFSTLGVDAALGRTFYPDEGSPGSPPVAVVSHSLWQRHLDSDPDAIGRTINLNDKTYTVIGVMPPDFRFLYSTEVWPILQLNPQQRRPPFGWRMIGRLKPGVSPEQVRAEFDAMHDEAVRLYPDQPNSDWAYESEPLKEYIVGDLRPMMLVLLVAVGFVLLIATGNVANLLLSRAATREREIAVRAALGASRLRLVRQLLTESLLLAAAGGVLGLLLALWGVDLLLALEPGTLPRLNEITIDPSVLVFTSLISLLSGVLFGLAPALAISRTSLSESLKEGGRSVTGARGQRMRAVLVVAQMALALMLLVGAGLMVRSFIRLQKVNPGFEPEGLLTAQLSLPQTRYEDPVKEAAFYRQVVERVRVLPGVQSASYSDSLPPDNLAITEMFEIEGQPTPPGQNYPLADELFIDNDYFRVLGIPVLQGRSLAETDNGNSPPVALINQTMLRRYFHDGEAIGKHIHAGGFGPEDPWITVVGVVGDVKYNGLQAEETPTIYVSYEQQAGARGSIYLLLRTSTDPQNLIAALRHEVEQMAPDLPLSNIRTGEQLLAEEFRQPRFQTMLIAIFALVALVLSAIGIYGVIAYSVTQRTHEIGIRMALGARPGDVLRLVIGKGMKLALIGVVVGLIAAFALTRLIENLLFKVSATDLLTYAVITVLLMAVALLACYIPARRATKVDPMIALRYE
jgi:putative ABC transport system permease protein